MRLLKKLLSILVLVVVILAVVGLFLPASIHIERELVIEAAPEKIFPHLNNLKKWTSWSPWFERDPNMKSTYSGPDEGVGAKVQWVSDSEGAGSQEVTESIPNKLVKTHLDFGDHGTADAQFNIAAIDQGSKVTWGFDSEFGYNLIGRYFGLMFEKWLGPDYEKGLSNLKRVVTAESDG